MVVLRGGSRLQQPMQKHKLDFYNNKIKLKLSKFQSIVSLANSLATFVLDLPPFIPTTCRRQGIYFADYLSASAQHSRVAILGIYLVRIF